MHVIIGGCGRVGAELAQRLSDGGHDVVVLDLGEGAFDRIGGTFNGETLAGDITDKDMLVRAGVEQANALIAVTNFDNANLMSVEIAKELFGVKKTVARLFNPEREDSYRKMGVHYVSGTRLVAKAILNELQSGTFPLHIGFDADVEIVEMRVRERAQGSSLADVEAIEGVRIAAIHRGTRVRVPRPDEELQSGDLLVGAVARGAHRKLRSFVEHPFAEGI